MQPDNLTVMKPAGFFQGYFFEKSNDISIKVKSIPELFKTFPGKLMQNKIAFKNSRNKLLIDRLSFITSLKFISHRYYNISLGKAGLIPIDTALAAIFVIGNHKQLQLQMLQKQLQQAGGKKVTKKHIAVDLFSDEFFYNSYSSFENFIETAIGFESLSLKLATQFCKDFSNSATINLELLKIISVDERHCNMLQELKKSTVTLIKSEIK